MLMRSYPAGILASLLTLSATVSAQQNVERGGAPQNPQVTVAVRFLSFIGDSSRGLQFARRYLPPAPENDLGVSSGVAILDDQALRQILLETQGEPRANVMQTPPINAIHGQTAAWQALDPQRFLTGADIAREGNHQVFRPRMEEIPVGVSISVYPEISADRRVVQLGLDATQTTVEPRVPLVPVHLVCKGEGADDRLVQVTQYLQIPKINTQRVKKTLTIADGDTALFAGWMDTREGRNEFGPPVLSKIPYVKRLFVTTVYDRDSGPVFILVTPRIAANAEQQFRASLATFQPRPSAEPMKQAAAQPVNVAPR